MHHFRSVVSTTIAFFRQALFCKCLRSRGAPSLERPRSGGAAADANRLAILRRNFGHGIRNRGNVINDRRSKTHANSPRSDVQSATSLSNLQTCARKLANASGDSKGTVNSKIFANRHGTWIHAQSRAGAGMMMNSATMHLP